MELNSYEYSAEQKTEGKWLASKLLLVLAYIAYTLVYLALIIKTGFVPLGALIPLTLWIIIFFTWRYTSPDYTYTVLSGELTFTVRYGGRTKRERFKLRIAEAESIAPLSELKDEVREAKKLYSALPSRNAADAYAIIFTQGGAKCAFIFKATRDALKILHFYNKNTKICETEL